MRPLALPVGSPEHSTKDQAPPLTPTLQVRRGPLWDLTQDASSIALIEAFQQQGKPMAFVCHAPCALLHVKRPNGAPLIQGKNVTGFSDTEEAGVKLTNVVPFLLEAELKKAGGHYSQGPDWSVHVVTDGWLITGQNPASSAEAAQALLKSFKH